VADAAIEIEAFVPIQTEPAQVFIHGTDELQLTTLVIKIFIAEDELTLSSSGALPRYPKGACMAQVEKSGRRRGKPPAIDILRRLSQGKRSAISV
jgi:hypothetical protein